MVQCVFKLANIFAKAVEAGIRWVRYYLWQRCKCVRENSFSATHWNGTFETPAPEGRSSLAQRFSAGKGGTKD